MVTLIPFFLILFSLPFFIPAMTPTIINTTNSSSVNEEDDQGITHLQKAIVANDEAMVRYLLDHGASIDYEDRYGNTPLFSAIISRNEPMTHLLLERGAPVSQFLRYGGSPILDVLLDPVHSELDNALVDLLLEYLQRQINNPDHEGNTVLHKAVIVPGGEKLVQFLLANGAKIHQLNKKGQSPINLVKEGKIQQLLAAQQARDHQRQQANLAFVMGLHSRTGTHSPVQKLPVFVIRDILHLGDNGTGPAAVEQPPTSQSHRKKPSRNNSRNDESQLHQELERIMKKFDKLPGEQRRSLGKKVQQLYQEIQQLLIDGQRLRDQRTGSHSTNAKVQVDFLNKKQKENSARVQKLMQVLQDLVDGKGI